MKKYAVTLQETDTPKGYTAIVEVMADGPNHAEELAMSYRFDQMEWQDRSGYNKNWNDIRATPLSVVVCDGMTEEI